MAPGELGKGIGWRGIEGTGHRTRKMAPNGTEVTQVPPAKEANWGNG